MEKYHFILLEKNLFIHALLITEMRKDTKTI